MAPLVASASETIRGLGPQAPEALVLLPDRNTEGKGDWSGAFHPEASRFAALHRAPPERFVQVDVGRTRVDRLQQTLAAIERCSTVSLLALFCHGWKGGVQLGPYSQDVEVLVRSLQLRARHDLAICLYACSTADGIDPDGDGPAPGGEGGFADALRDALLRAGIGGAHVDAHTVAGHTARNPYVRRFDASTAQGGDWLIAPDDPLWSTWRTRLRDSADPLRFRFPILTRDEIREELARTP